MSDSFIAILGMGFLMGVITTLIIVGVTNERTNDIDLDMRTYIPVRDRNRCGDKRSLKQLEAEKAIRERAEKLGVKIGE